MPSGRYIRRFDAPLQRFIVKVGQPAHGGDARGGVERAKIAEADVEGRSHGGLERHHHGDDADSGDETLLHLFASSAAHGRRFSRVLKYAGRPET